MQHHKGDNPKLNAIFVSHTLCVFLLGAWQSRNSIFAWSMAIHREKQRLNALLVTAPADMDGVLPKVTCLSYAASCMEIVSQQVTNAMPSIYSACLVHSAYMVSDR